MGIKKRQLLSASQKIKIIIAKVEAYANDELVPLMKEHSEYRYMRAAELKNEGHEDCMGQSLIEADAKYPNEGAAHAWLSHIAAGRMYMSVLEATRDEKTFNITKKLFSGFVEHLMNLENIAPVTATIKEFYTQIAQEVDLIAYEGYSNKKSGGR